MREQHRLKKVYLEFDDGSVFELDMEAKLNVTLDDQLGPPGRDPLGSSSSGWRPTWRKIKFTLTAERLITFDTQIGRYIKGADKC